MRRLLPAVLAASTACLQYSPHALPTDAADRDLHAKALAALAERSTSSASDPGAAPPLRFAIVGDTQLFFDETADAVAHLRGGAYAFVVQAGDFTHFGLLEEFRLMRARFDGLGVPFLVAIGNHDLLGNGGDIYERMFGGRDFWFVHGRTRVVVFDSNSREAGFSGAVPSLAFLAQALAPGPDHDRVVLVSHVPPGHADFDPALEQAYLALIRGAGPALSFHAHEHGFRAEVREGVPLWVADAMDGRTYLAVELRADGSYTVERVPF